MKLTIDFNKVVTVLRNNKIKTLDFKNNYLLTGNKVALFHRDKLEMFYYPSDSEGNDSSLCK